MKLLSLVYGVQKKEKLPVQYQLYLVLHSRTLLLQALTPLWPVAQQVYRLQLNRVLGVAPRFRIRGVGSINQGTYPLVVVDGVPIQTGDLGGDANTNSLGDINPSDIESMEILRMDQQQPFTVHASNGVLLITTKHGVTGKMKVNYSNYFGVAQPIRLFDLFGAKDFVTISNEKRSNAGLSAIAANDGAASLESFSIPTGSVASSQDECISAGPLPLSFQEPLTCQVISLSGILLRTE